MHNDFDVNLAVLNGFIAAILKYKETMLLGNMTSMDEGEKSL